MANFIAELTLFGCHIDQPWRNTTLLPNHRIAFKNSWEAGSMTHTSWCLGVVPSGLWDNQWGVSGFQVDVVERC